MSTNKRIADLLRLTFCGVFMGVIFVISGLYAFNNQGCKDGYYENLGIECLKCTEFLGLDCLTCDTSKTCTSATVGNYV